jgi:hypothetical protein
MKLKSLAREYGGKWKKDGKMYTNQEGKSARQVSGEQGRAYNKKKDEYLASQKSGAPDRRTKKNERGLTQEVWHDHNNSGVGYGEKDAEGNYNHTGKAKKRDEASEAKKGGAPLLGRVKGSKNKLPKLIRVKNKKKEDSRELAAFKQQMLDRRKADKQAEKDAKKAKKNKGKNKKKKDHNWKINIGNVSVGNASNPELQKKKEPTAAEKKAKLDAIRSRSEKNKNYKVVS